ncbi:MAG: DNA-binding NarL/FixJ family response regulator [Candidatus Aldehydirespiratoraceae bacterium]
MPADDLRVLVADDHALYRRGLVTELDDADDLEVIAEACDGEEAVAEAIALAPDVILMDVRMPGIDGIEATRRILEATPTTRVLMLSVSDEPDDLLEAIKAGAAGYLLKETSINDIAESTRRVARGHSFVSPVLAGRLLAEFSRLARRADVGEEDAVRAPLLMPREVAVLEAMADGATDERIAAQMGLSAASTRNHVRNILEKLQLESRTAAVLYAVRSRLIDP